VPSPLLHRRWQARTAQKIAPSAATLPTVNGSGAVTDLPVAAAQSGALAGLLASYSPLDDDNAAVAADDAAVVISRFRPHSGHPCGSMNPQHLELLSD
jgi:hypothetical protein